MAIALGLHFLYRGDEDAMGIAGDHVGARQEAPMVRAGTSDLFYYSARLLPDARMLRALLLDGD